MSEVRQRVGLHRKQLEIFKDPYKIRLCCAARRFGKTRLILWDALTSALSFSGTVDPVSPEVILLTEPTRVQASGLLWKPLVSLCESEVIAPLVSSINRSEYRVDFVGGRPSIMVTGVNDRDGDGLRGKRLYRFYGDEWQDSKPSVLDTVVLPAMADTPGSRALLTFTPKGPLNHTFGLIQRAQEDPDTYSYHHARTVDNPFVLKDEVERARRTLPPRIFRQEFEASIEDFPGKVYTELSSRNLVPSAPQADRYFLGVDFGELYPALVVLGLTDGVWTYVEGWQGNHGTDREAQPVPQTVVDQEILRLARTYQISGCYCDPSRPSAILGIRAIGDAHSLPGLTRAVAGYNRIDDGISQVHSLIYQQRLVFQERPQDPGHPWRVHGTDAFTMAEAYHYKIDREGRVTEAIEDGQADHILDAIRYTVALAGGS